MFRHLLLFVVLMALWVPLSGHIDPASAGDLYLMGCGVAASFLITLVVWRVGFLGREGPVFAIFFRGILYVPWLLWQIVLSARDVTVLVWSPRPKINPKLIRIPYRTQSELATAIYANSITLTPGTITVEVDAQQREFVVHVLSQAFEGGLAPMHDRVRGLEGAKE